MRWTKKTIEAMKPIWDAEVQNMLDWQMGKDKEENKEVEPLNNKEDENRK